MTPTCRHTRFAFRKETSSIHPDGVFFHPEFEVVAYLLSPTTSAHAGRPVQQVFLPFFIFSHDTARRVPQSPSPFCGESCLTHVRLPFGRHVLCCIPARFLTATLYLVFSIPPSSLTSPPHCHSEVSTEESLLYETPVCRQARLHPFSLQDDRLVVGLLL